MSLIGTLNIGKSALAVHQAAIQVAGNNIANAGDPQYTRQATHIVQSRDVMLRQGVLIGTGVNLQSIERQIDEALEGRLRLSISDSEGAQATQMWLGRVEAVFQELGDADLSSQLSIFFNGWSNLANRPQDMALRQIVQQNGQSLASMFRDLRGQLTGLQIDLDERLKTLVSDANSLADQVADLNEQIIAAEAGSGATANALRDQRDAVLKRLSELIDIRVQDTGQGVVNVVVGSTPLILGDHNRGVMLDQDAQGDTMSASIVTAADRETLVVSSGQIGALMQARGEIQGVVDQLDSLAAGLIFELNKLYSSGQALEGFTQVTAGNAAGDPAAALNAPDARLNFAPVNGSFVVHVKQKSTGLASSTLIQVDLDGSSGDTSLESLRASLDAVDGISASITGGRLQIRADSPDVECTFSQDSSGALAALGINTFFTGSNARDIAVVEDLKSHPGMIAAARNGEPADNQTARAIAALESATLPSLAGASLKDSYEAMINAIAISASTAKTSAQAALAVRDTLANQREALSGVSLDEEAINLMREQRAFQGAARVIAAVDELMRTILQMV